mgnify:CR=1 FL=1
MLKKKSVTFDDTKMLDIKIQSINKDDFNEFKNSKIPLSDGTYVSLHEIADFNIIND